MVLGVYLFSERTRQSEFYEDLTREAVTKAHLFLSDRVEAAVMHSIYSNNRKFLDEVEVALYTPSFELLYHDAQDIDIIKETPELIRAATTVGKLEFYENGYQAIAMRYNYQGVDYIITAAAYDGYGYKKQQLLVTLLLVLWLVGLLVITLIGYLLACSALRPVRQIVNEVGVISESNLDRRLSVKSDRDELDELSETFNQMLDRLEQSFLNQKMFVSNVAHEIRTPLAALMAELEIALLREERSSSEYRSVITHALGDAKELTHLAAGLLDLAKANYDLNQIATTELRLDELLLDAREVVLKAHSLYHIDLIIDEGIDDERAITVIANDYLLKTAFVNLIENNCKYSENGRCTIHLASTEEQAVITFHEEGAGMNEEDLVHLFTPFYRGTNAMGIKGHGIGLALTKRIVELHRGTLSVSSQKGVGSRFTITLGHL